MTVLELPTARRAMIETPTASRLRWWTGHRLVLAVSLVTIAVLHLVNLGGWPLFFDDEGTYVAQAWSVYTKSTLAHYTYWYDHPPAGWLQLAALMVVPDALGAQPTVLLARYAMVLYTVATAFLIQRLCRNLGLHRVTGVLAMLAWGLCPLVVFEGRQVMLDNMAMPWILAAFVLATSRRQALWQHLLAGLCFGVGVLTKETTAVVAPALLFALWASAYRPTRKFSVMGAVVMTALVVGVYPLYALLKSELVAGPGHVSVQDAVKFQLGGRTGSGALWDPSSVAHDVLRSWLFYDSVLPVAGVIAGLFCLLVRRLRPVGLVTMLMVLVAIRPGGYLPLMYVIGILPFAAVALLGVAELVVLQLARRVWVRAIPVGAALALVSVLAGVGYVAPRWVDRNVNALTSASNDPYSAALGFVTTQVDHRSKILVDDAYFNPLVNAGWNDDGWHGAIWYFKLDLDPIVRDAQLKDGWRDIDYILVNDVMVQNFDGLEKLPQLQETYLHSHLVKQWGSGQERVQLRRIEPRRAAFRSMADASRATTGQ